MPTPDTNEVNFAPNYSRNRDNNASHFSRIRAWGPPSTHLHDVLWPTCSEWGRMFRLVDKVNQIDRTLTYEHVFGEISQRHIARILFNNVSRYNQLDRSKPSTKLFLIQCAFNAVAELRRIFNWQRSMVHHKIEFIKVRNGIDHRVEPVFNGRCCLTLDVAEYETLAAQLDAQTQPAIFWLAIETIYNSIRPNSDILYPAWRTINEEPDRPRRPRRALPAVSDLVQNIAAEAPQIRITLEEVDTVGPNPAAPMTVEAVDVALRVMRSQEAAPFSTSHAEQYKRIHNYDLIPIPELSRLIQTRGHEVSQDVRDAVYELLVADDIAVSGNSAR